MKKSLLFLFATAFCQLITFAQVPTAREEVSQDINRTGGNYYAYPTPTSTMSKAPKGYEPFYINHYGRHGSRWLLDDGDYSDNIRILEQADELGKLTQKGKETLSKLKQFYTTTIRRLGDLTTVGERQHHGIGKRMTEHFPEVFKGTPYVDARSTVVIRCILSMTAECEEITAFNPRTVMHNDVSESLQYYLNKGWDGEVRRQSSTGVRGRAVDEAKEKYTHPERFCKLLFNDQQYVADSINAKSFMRHMCEIATNMQSHDSDISFYDLFTEEELYDIWKIKNIDWYLGYGAAPQMGGVMPFAQENLLRNMLETADTIVGNKSFNGATLRFGHEICLMPLACLLELDSCGVQVDNLDELDTKWVSYRIYPMACNVQLVYYRPKKGDGDILVKALLNENETTIANLPKVEGVEGYYYKWTDVRAYFTKKLDDFDAKYPKQVFQPRQRRR